MSKVQCPRSDVQGPWRDLVLHIKGFRFYSGHSPWTLDIRRWTLDFGPEPWTVDQKEINAS